MTSKIYSRFASVGLSTLLVAIASTCVPASAGILTAIASGVAVHAIVKNLDHAGTSDNAVTGRESSSHVNATLPAIGNGFTACSKLFPQNKPLSMDGLNKEWRPKALCFDDFAVLYSGLSKTPMVTFEMLNKEKLANALDEKRTDNFFPDARLSPSERSELADYRGSGYDRGHMAPAGDRPTALAMNQSFSLSNMIPQNPVNNQKIWSKVESDVRKFGRRAQGNVYVFTGPIFTTVAGQQKTIGRDNVWVPAQMFKLVFDEASGRAWAYIVDNTSTAPINAPMDYAHFVQATGWQLLPNLSK